MPDVLVLCYHALSPSWNAALSVTPEDFERQIDHLLRRGWEPVTFGQAALNPPAKRTLSITFDDAFASVRRYAAPILTRLGAPATVFAPTTYMQAGGPLDWPGVAHWAQTERADELRAMDWDGLRELRDLGWEIGSHTRSHPRLTQLESAVLDQELEASRSELTYRLGEVCQTVAYPYGDVDRRVAARAQAAGYTAAAALDRHLQRLGPYRTPRVGIYHGDSWRRFALKAFRPMRQLRATGLWAQSTRTRSARQSQA